MERKKTITTETGAAGNDSKGKQPEGTPITVHSFSGYKRDERPRSFELEGRKLSVLRVKKSWREESEKGRRRKTFFRVHAHDGRTYEIALDESSGQWTLEPRRDRA